MTIHQTIVVQPQGEGRSCQAAGLRAWIHSGLSGLEYSDIHAVAIHENHKDIDAVPSCKPSIFKCLRKPHSYPKTKNTLGHHIRARRLDYGLEQKDLAKKFGVSKDTIKNWENNHTKEIEVRFYPEIMDFLGYCPYEIPKTWGEKFKQHRIHQGLNQRDLAKILKITQSTIGRWERGTLPSWGEKQDKAEWFMNTYPAFELSTE